MGKKQCPPMKAGTQECNNHGVCQYGKCHCYAGFKGEDCGVSMKTTALPASHEAADIAAKVGNVSVTASVKVTPAPPMRFKEVETVVSEPCPDKCTGNGECDRKSGKCFCHPGFKGAACAEVIPCPHNCNNGNGQCWRGKCFCHPGFKGEDCAIVDAKPSRHIVDAQQTTLAPTNAAATKAAVAAVVNEEKTAAVTTGGGASLKADGKQMLGNMGIGAIAVGAAVMGLVAFAAVSSFRRGRSASHEEMSARAIPVWVDEE